MSDHMSEKLTQEQVQHVARLSRLHLTDQQVHDFAQQLSAVLEHVSRLDELDVQGVEPLSHAVDLVNVLRDDQPQAGLDVQQALANAPEQLPPFFQVPKVLGDGSDA